MDPHMKSDSSILIISVLHSNFDVLGCQPAKKPCYPETKQTPEERKEREEILEKERTVESTRKKQVKGEEAGIAADEEERARLSGTFQAMKQNIFKHVHKFMTSLLTSANQATSSQARRRSSDHGEKTFIAMATKNPDVATEWAHKGRYRCMQPRPRIYGSSFNQAQEARSRLSRASPLQPL